ncbi:MAG TPA: AMP-binding protein [Gaiellaceae bacterium]
MIGLRELRQPDAATWEDAERGFSLPPLETYNIAADCLRGGAPDAPALLVVDGEQIAPVSFAELDERSAAFAKLLADRGVTPGDRVAVKLSQSLEMAVAILGILRAGAVFVPISNVLGADGIAHRLAHSGTRVLVAVDGDITPGEIRAARGGGGAFAMTAPETPALLLYTSGTTGKPKGVLHGHRVVLGHHPIDWAWDRVRDSDVAYSPVDWAWAGGLFLGLLVPLAYGVPVIAYREPRFDAERTLDVLERCGASIGLFPPTVLRMLRQSGVTARDSLRVRCFITGAEAVEPELFGWAEDALGVVVNNAYGLTEANALVGHSRTLGALDLNALGRAYPGRRLRVVGEDGVDAAAAEHGQIAVAADDLVCMLRYWDDEEATAARIVDGWLITGDTVHADPDGLLHFHGRADDIIKSGAYRIGPAEVEAVILRHDAVAECAVVGLPDPVRGQTVTAVVRLREGSNAGDGFVEELQSAVRGAVGAHAYPREIRFVDELPKTTTGKVDRATLRRALVTA